jgi:two-component system, LytTR family, response regulator
VTQLLRILIVDDERLARQHLRQLVDKIPDAECVGESPNGTSALAMLSSIEVDVMLLDIQMPGIDAFDVVRSIPTAKMPAIIFVTAHDHYAVKAFEVSATDYLLKPPDPERLERALQAARMRIQSRTFVAEQSRLRALVESLKPATGTAELVVRDRGRSMRIPVTEVDWLQAEDNYVRVYTGGRSHLIRATIAGLEHDLDASRFVRIHRSIVVNIDRARELRHSLSGGYSLLLTSGEKLPVSRGHRKRVAEFFAVRSPRPVDSSPQ